MAMIDGMNLPASILTDLSRENSNLQLMRQMYLETCEGLPLNEEEVKSIKQGLDNVDVILRNLQMQKEYEEKNPTASKYYQSPLILELQALAERIKSYGAHCLLIDYNNKQ
jgi:hypothetical protein